MTTASQDMSLEPRHYAQIFWRRKGVILLSVVTVFCSALVALSFMPDEYEATVTLIFNEPQTPLPEVSAQGSQGIRDDARLNAFASRIKNQPFLARVARMLPTTMTPTVRAAAEEIHRKNQQASVDEIAIRLVVERISSRLRFGSRGSGVYFVVVADSDPETARLLAYYIGEFYRDDTKQEADKEYQDNIRFLESEARTHEESLREAEARVEQYQRPQIQETLTRSSVRAENQATAENLQRKVRHLAEDAEREVRNCTDALARAGIERATADATWREAEFIQYAGRLKTSLIDAVSEILTAPPAPGADPTWPPTEGRSYDLRQGLRSRLEARVRSIQPQANAATVNAYVDYVISRIDAQTQSEVAHDVDQRIQDYITRAQNQPAEEFELDKLKQDVQNKRALLEVFRSTETKNRILQAVQNASLGRQVKILDPPKLPLSPSRPNRVKILLGALLLGTMFGLGLAFLNETMDPTVRSLADIQRVAPEPILCTTPLLSKLQPRVRGVRRFWLPAAVSAVVVLTLVFLVARTMVVEDSVPGAAPARAANEAPGGR